MTNAAENRAQIRHLDEANPTALYRHYDGQLEPQGCYVSLDLRDGELTADWNGEIGNAVPMSVWHGQVLRWGIPCLTAKSANRLLDEIKPIAQRVLDGAEIVWDGDNNVGQLDEQAQVASEEIGTLCEDIAGPDSDYPCVVEYPAADWYSEGEQPAVTATMTDDELQELAGQLQVDDGGTGSGQTMTDNPGDFIVLAGLDDFLEGLRAAARELVEADLEEAVENIDDATRRRDELVRTINWLSGRQIAELAAVSHTQVQRILAKETGIEEEHSDR